MRGNTSTIRSNFNNIKDIKQVINQRNGHKFMAQTIRQNFFVENNFDEEYTSSSHFDSKIRVSSPGQTVGRKIRTSSRRKKNEQIKLEPFKQKQKEDIFLNKSLQNNIGDIEQIQIVTPPQFQQIKDDINTLSENIHNSRRKNRRKMVQKQQKMQIQLNRKSNNSSKVDITQSLFFDQRQGEDDAYQMKKTQSLQEKPTYHHEETIFTIPMRAFTHQFKDDDQQQQHVQKQKQQQKVQKQQTSKQINNSIINYVSGSEYYKFSNQLQLRRQLWTDVRQNTTLKMQIIRDKDGFNTFWPQFHLLFVNDHKHVLSAKKTSSRPTTTFILSRSKNDFDQKSIYYFGKIKSNIIGDVLNIFGPGLNPANAKQNKVTPRQLLATIVYTTHLFHPGGPRRFSIYVKKPQIKYYQDFQQVCMYQSQIPLHTLYENNGNKSKIRVIHNRSPKFIQKIGGYYIDFRGKAPCVSVKNFILEQPLTGAQLLLFGKSDENKFNLQVSSNMSTYLGFAIAIASFDNRLIFQ